MRALWFAVLLSLLPSILPPGLPPPFWQVSSAYAQSKVQIAVPDYPPFCNEAAEGLTCDLYRAAYRAVGIEAQLRVMPIRRGEVQLLNNQIDAVAAADLFAKGKALERITSVPVVNVLVSLFFYSPNYALPDTLDSLEALRGHTVAAITNSPYLEQYQQLGLVITEAETPEQLLQMLKRGRVQLAESTLLTGFYLIQKHLPAVADQFDYLHIGNLESSLTFHLGNPNTAALKAQFEQGLQRIWDSGEYKAILERYWGPGNVPQAVFIRQHPIQGVDQSNPIDYLSLPRDQAGRIMITPSQP